MRRSLIIGLAACVVGLGVVAEAAEGKNVIRFGGAYVSPTGDLSGAYSIEGDLGNGTMLTVEGTLTLEPQSAVAPFFGYERRFTNRLGLEVATWLAKHDVDGRVQGTYWLLDSGTGMLIETGSIDVTDTFGEVNVMPLSVGLNVHLIPKSRVDLYVGPTLDYVFYGDFKVEGESLSIDDDVTWGAVLGLDIPLGDKGWMLTGAARYLDTEAEPTDMGPGDAPLDVKPWIVQISAGYHF